MLHFTECAGRTYHGTVSGPFVFCKVAKHLPERYCIYLRYFFLLWNGRNNWCYRLSLKAFAQWVDGLLMRWVIKVANPIKRTAVLEVGVHPLSIYGRYYKASIYSLCWCAHHSSDVLIRHRHDSGVPTTNYRTFPFYVLSNFCSSSFHFDTLFFSVWCSQWSGSQFQEGLCVVWKAFQYTHAVTLRPTAYGASDRFVNTFNKNVLSVYAKDDATC